MTLDTKGVILRVFIEILIKIDSKNEISDTSDSSGYGNDTNTE